MCCGTLLLPLVQNYVLVYGNKVVPRPELCKLKFHKD